ncbi:MAG: hypothetical protein HC809_01660 [Gammaproteobacteria bacterium]|nr:hypothetical protein [Gammaproteobacteria bacterium]
MAGSDLSHRVGVFRWAAYSAFAPIPLLLSWRNDWHLLQFGLFLTLIGLPILYGALERRVELVDRWENLVTPLLAAGAGLPLVPGLVLLAALLAGTWRDGACERACPHCCAWVADGSPGGVWPVMRW